MKIFKITKKKGCFSLRICDLIFTIHKVTFDQPVTQKKKQVQNPPGIKHKPPNQKFRNKAKYHNFVKRCKKELPRECWNCGSEKDLQLHHIKEIRECLDEGNEDAIIDIKNAIYLCKICHKQFHKDCSEAKNSQGVN